jgi:glycosyltransferase involved in cell wall biosynthesis
MLVVGSGTYQARLAAAVDGFGLDGRIMLLGWTRDPAETFQAADIVLLPSLWEGLPRTLIEAQAAGRPIVASNIKGNREIVSPETGFLCPPCDASAYARPLADLIDSPSLRERMGSAARRRAEMLFDSAANNRRIVQLYDELLMRDDRNSGVHRFDASVDPAGIPVAA